MEAIGTSCYSSNLNYVGYSPFATTTTPTNSRLSTNYYGETGATAYFDDDIKPFDQRYALYYGASAVPRVSVSKWFKRFLPSLLYFQQTYGNNPVGLYMAVLTKLQEEMKIVSQVTSLIYYYVC